MISAYLRVTLNPIDLILSASHSSVSVISAVKSPKEFSEEKYIFLPVLLGTISPWRDTFVRRVRVDFSTEIGMRSHRFTATRVQSVFSNFYHPSHNAILCKL